MLSKRHARAILGAVLMSLLVAGEAQGQVSSPRSDDRWEISLGVGYYLPARDGFREYYRDGPETELTASYRFSHWMSARVDFFFTRLLDNEVQGDLQFRIFSVVPSVKVTLPKAHLPYLGAGVGYYRGTVIYRGEYYPITRREQEISKGGIGVKIYGGLKSFIVGRLFLAVKGRYCHTSLGDPYEGDFGNVGGFSVMGKLGVSF